MEYTITLFDSIRSTYVTQNAIRKLDIQDLFAMLSKPVITEDKHNVQAWAGAECSPGRRKNNPVKGYSILVLDYDTGLSVDEFIEQYASLAFVLHTTWSHGQDGKDRFRVAVPFSKQAPPEIYAEMAPILQDIFTHVDPNGFGRLHLFNLPSCPENRVSLFRSHINEGYALDAVDLYSRCLWRRDDKLRKEEERSKRHDTFLQDKSHDLREAEKIVWKIHPNLPYGDWIRVGMALRKEFGDIAQHLFVEWSLSGGYNDQNSTTLKSKYRSFRPGSVGFGSLIHIMQKYPR